MVSPGPPARSEHDVWNKQTSEDKFATYPKLVFRGVLRRLSIGARVKDSDANEYKATAASVEGAFIQVA